MQRSTRPTPAPRMYRLIPGLGPTRPPKARLSTSARGAAPRPANPVNSACRGVWASAIALPRPTAEPARMVRAAVGHSSDAITFRRLIAPRRCPWDVLGRTAAQSSVCVREGISPINDASVLPSGWPQHSWGRRGADAAAAEAGPGHSTSSRGRGRWSLRRCYLARRGVVGLLRGFSATGGPRPCGRGTAGRARAPLVRRRRPRRS